MVTQPICGEDWLRQHRLDYTQRDIGSLTIILSVDKRRLPAVSNKDRGIVKHLVKSYRKEKK